MSKRITCALAVLILTLVGCGGVPSLPASFEVATSAAEKTEAPRDTGPPSFAGTTWSLARIADPDDSGDAADSAPRGPYGGILSGDRLERPPVGERIFLIEFGDQGQMVHVTQNRYFLPKFYGGDVQITEEWHRTTLPGVLYNSASYGLEVADRFGIAVNLHVRFGNFFLGRAILYSWGTRTEDSIGGQFGYLLDFTDGVVRSLGTIADQYPVEGHEVESPTD